MVSLSNRICYAHVFTNKCNVLSDSRVPYSNVVRIHADSNEVLAIATERIHIILNLSRREFA